ncbi:MAG: sulfate transporter CysZ [Gammaproteobacteria bacterium]|nr:sulfate transporter CysZ [Gammaproteobacteria bacterium]MDH5652204.1 sulfate transporter CysZ [Gammaproteobacteria bacterium]
MSGNPITGASYFLRGLTLIRQPGIKKYVIIPLIINVILFSVLIWLSLAYFKDTVDSLVADLPSWLSWITGAIWILLAACIALGIYFSFTIVANLIGAPFNSYLAAAVEKHLTGQTPPEVNRSISKEIIFSISNELRKLLYFLMWGIPLFIITFIPVVNLVAPLLWFYFGTWMLAVEYADYPMGNHGLGFKEILDKLAEKKVMSLGFGGAVMFGTMLPVFNFLVMPAAVAGATVMRVEQFPVNQQK